MYYPDNVLSKFVEDFDLTKVPKIPINKVVKNANAAEEEPSVTVSETDCIRGRGNGLTVEPIADSYELPVTSGESTRSDKKKIRTLAIPKEAYVQGCMSTYIEKFKKIVPDHLRNLDIKMIIPVDGQTFNDCGAITSQMCTDCEKNLECGKGIDNLTVNYGYKDCEDCLQEESSNGFYCLQEESTNGYFIKDNTIFFINPFGKEPVPIASIIAKVGKPDALHAAQLGVTKSQRRNTPRGKRSTNGLTLAQKKVKRTKVTTPVTSPVAENISTSSAAAADVQERINPCPTNVTSAVTNANQANNIQERLSPCPTKVTSPVAENISTSSAAAADVQERINPCPTNVTSAVTNANQANNIQERLSPCPTKGVMPQRRNSPREKRRSLIVTSPVAENISTNSAAAADVQERISPCPTNVTSAVTNANQANNIQERLSPCPTKVSCQRNNRDSFLRNLHQVIQTVALRNTSVPDYVLHKLIAQQIFPERMRSICEEEEGVIERTRNLLDEEEEGFIGFYKEEEQVSRYNCKKYQEDVTNWLKKYQT